MDPAENSLCPRCGQAFRCGTADAGPCACTTLAIDAARLAELARRYNRCLCVACLATLNSGSEPAADARSNAASPR